MDSDERWKPWLSSLGVMGLALSLPSVLVAIFSTGFHGLEVLLVSLYFYLLGASYIAAKSTEFAGRGHASSAMNETKCETRLRTAYGVGLLLIAVGLFMYFLIKVFNNAGGIAYFFGGGLFLIVVGMQPIFERNRLKPEDFKLADHITWLDFYASADPVPNGPLFDKIPDSLMTAFEVHNQGSLVKDHTTYWKNYDGFVGPVACALADLDEIRLNELKQRDRENLEVAKHRRAWRVEWLTAARVITALFAIIISFFLWKAHPEPWNYPSPPFWHYLNLSASAVLDLINAVREKTINYLPFVNGKWELPPPRVVLVIAILFAVLVWYYALYWVWRWWNWRDTTRFFIRIGYGTFDMPFVVFLLLLVTGVEVGAFAMLDWAGGLPTGLVYSMSLGGSASFGVVFMWGLVVRPLRGKAAWGLPDYLIKILVGAAIVTLFLMPFFVDAATRFPHNCTSPDILLCARPWIVVVCLLTLVGACVLWLSRIGARIREWVEAWSHAGPTAVAWARLRARHIIEEVERYGRILRILHGYKQELVERGTSENEQGEWKAALQDTIAALIEEEKMIIPVLNKDESRIGQNLLRSLTVKSQEAQEILTATRGERQIPVN